MYADDTCLMAPTATAMQNLLDVCHNYGAPNDILFNPLISVCIVYKQKYYKLFCPSINIGSQPIRFVNETKYLGFTFCNLNKDAKDILRQMRSVYARSNRILRMFSHCSIDVKIVLFNSYCTHLYCSYLWTDYRKTSFSKIRVAFNNAYRRIFGLSNRSSASAMNANYNICNFETILRKNISNFIQRLENCTNSIMPVLMQSWHTKFEDWKHWHKLLYTCF